MTRMRIAKWETSLIKDNKLDQHLKELIQIFKKQMYKKIK